ncbi:unnamed protein product [Candidula unifasciata]|uniref:WD repeat-containing protein 25 n=1 Tax=Candidula unifasciata TaxID=100452 RepID=A0A8S3ZH13_9EUPU|nr:unnamed protein product [Candidula unifasciata]
MDSLKNYGSESEEETAEDTILDSSEKFDTLTLNFLGLEKPRQTKSNVFKISQTLGAQPEIRKVQTNWGEVDIPDGDFWTDFEPDSTNINPTHTINNSGCHTTVISKSCVIATNSQSLHTSNSPWTQNILQYPNSYQSQNALQLHSLKRDIYCSNSSDEREVGFSRNKRARLSDQRSRFSHDCPHPLGDHTPERQGLSFSSKDHHSHQNLREELRDNSLQSQPEPKEKRKLFYIHSKVAPYVNLTPTNKCANRRLSSWTAHDGVINRLAWNIPSFSHLLVTAGMDTSVKVWNVWSSLDPCVARLSSHKKAVKHVEWCHTGRKVLSCSCDRTAQVTDIETAKILGTYEHMGFVTAGQIHPSNPNLFVTGTDNLVVKWDMRTPQAPVKHFSYKDKFGQVQDLLFINNGQEFVSCSDLVSRDCADRTVMVWDLRMGTVLSNQIYQELYVCTRLKTNPNSSQFLAQSHAGYVALFSTTPPYKMDKSKRYEGHKIEGHCIGFDISPDGTLVYSGSAGNDVHCYHQNSGKLLRKLSCKNDIVTDVACHPVLPSCLASCTWGGSVSLWM